MDTWFDGPDKWVKNMSGMDFEGRASEPSPQNLGLCKMCLSGAQRYACKKHDFGINIGSAIATYLDLSTPDEWQNRNFVQYNDARATTFRGIKGVIRRAKQLRLSDLRRGKAGARVNIDA